MHMLLGLIVALVVSVAATAKADAACMDLDDCHNTAAYHQAASENSHNKGLWFQAAARSDFANAADWNNRASLYFIAGQAIAAQWAKATADHYSGSAVQNARASDDWFAKARFYAAAADDAFRRYVFIGNGPDDGDGIASISARSIGTGSLKKAKAICKRHWAANAACRAVQSKIVEGAARYVWRMVGGGTCLRQQTHYRLAPSTYHIIGVYHRCIRWG